MSIDDGLSRQVKRPTVGSVLAAMYDAWRRFWFSKGDPTLLGLIRICCGILVVYTLFAYALDFDAIFGKHALMNLELRLKHVREYPWTPPPLNWVDPDNPAQLPDPESKDEARSIREYGEYWGLDPRRVYAIGAPVWSIWFHITDPTVAFTLHLIFIGVAVLFTLGVGGRVTAAVLWFAFLSYIHRAPSTLFGVDTMMLIVLMYMMIAPCTAALSLDRVIARWWRNRQGMDPLPDKPALSVSANFALRLLQVHLCFIYASAGLAKLKGESWWNGTAIWGTLANFEFAPMQSPLYVALLELLVANRTILEAFLFAGTYFTLFFEIGYPFLIWNRYTRWLMLFMAVVLHGLIGICMGLRTFAFMMLVMNMAFLPQGVVHWFLGRLRAWLPGPPSEAPPDDGGEEKVGITSPREPMHA